MIKLLYCSVHCCNKGFLITFGKPNFKQYSATSSKHLKQLQYALSQDTNCGPNSILLLLLVVGETDMTISRDENEQTIYNLYGVNTINELTVVLLV